MMDDQTAPEDTLPERIARFESELIPHPTHKQALDAIRALHSRWRPPHVTKRPKARALLLVGESGAGKSSVLEQFHDKFPDIRLDDVVDGMIGGVPVEPELLERLRDADHKPILVVELTSRMTERQLVGALFGALGYKDRPEWNQADVIGKIADYAAELWVQLIFIDEGHNMVRLRRPKGASEVIEFLKSLLNRIGIPIVIAGLPELLDIQRDKRDRQMARRLQAAVHLVPYDWWTVDGRTKFLALLRRFEKKLGLPEASNLSDHDFAARIYVATAGEVGWISKYLSLALELAVIRNMGSVTIDLLAEVHDSLERSSAPSVQKLSFDQKLDLAPRPSAWESLDPAGNPFLCAFEALPDLLEARRDALRDAVPGTEGRTPGKPRDDSRNTGLQARGAPTFAPFGRN